jgi:hypothetical protein
MKQKYEILKDEDNKRLIIREYAELDKDVMSLLCEESYGVATAWERRSTDLREGIP